MGAQAQQVQANGRGVVSSKAQHSAGGAASLKASATPSPPHCATGAALLQLQQEAMAASMSCALQGIGPHATPPGGPYRKGLACACVQAVLQAGWAQVVGLLIVAALVEEAAYLQQQRSTAGSSKHAQKQLQRLMNAFALFA